ncbi:c-type cytochrome [Alkalilimnicola ehrlichii MLHE-1]|uniref:Putative cytochrome c n=1 Tax=Alkalilimnicola ehrlichii (strain ATCC BAA-1101 / DSM 17681 / MLHE-1) TaxID=187272 RepID=Q0ACJ7_ALKEH|nr:c-type cytochrome [Alkalilimnicola ehrlichii]ABI55440.1 putative cytochrome c [Alkalilimnicola ehrlichii MLHE-1]
MSKTQDQTFVNTFIGIIILLALIALALAGLSQYTGGTLGHVAEQRAEHERERVLQAIAPVGQVAIAGRDEAPDVVEDDVDPEVAEVEEPAEPEERPAFDAEVAQQINQAACMACHATGVAGSPVTGEEGEWAPRFEERGLDGLVNNVISGMGAMPPRGGADADDTELRWVVIWMLEEAGLAVDY